LFRKQIEAGAPITLTHLETNRYFMTIPEASQLVIQAGSMGRGGEIYVLDMGKPVKIIDLAKRMIRLSGETVCDDNCPKGGIRIEVTGLRPGEKLFEELLINNNVERTEHPLIMRANERELPWDFLNSQLDELAVASRSFNYEKVLNILSYLVEEYTPSPHKGNNLHWRSMISYNYQEGIKH